MVAVGAALASIGCYSVPQQTGSVASAAAVSARSCRLSRRRAFVKSLVVSQSERSGLNRGAAYRCCSTHQPRFFLGLIPSSVLPRLAEGYLVQKNASASTLASVLRR